MRNTLITVFIAAAVAFLVQAYTPLSFFDYLPHPEPTPNLGSTITTIQGSDTLSASRSVINTNFSNLNTDKLEGASIDTCSELAALLGDETGTCGAPVLSVVPTLQGFLSTASSTFTGNATTTGTHGFGALYINSERFTELTGTNLEVSAGALKVTDNISVTQATSTYLGFSSLTAVGQIPFSISATGSLFGTTTSALLWDNTNGRFSIGSSTPKRSIVFKSAAAVECTLTDAATVTFDLTQCNQARVTLTDNRTIDFTNQNEAMGQGIRFVVCQDGTGSRTLTWDSAVRWAGGTAPTLTTTANKCDVVAGFVTAATGTPIILLDKSLNF